MAGAVPAAERLRRLLSLVPWVTAHPEGVEIAAICARFDVTRAQLLADLEVLSMVGIYPYTPDVLIEVFVADDVVTISLADYFSRPLQLTPGEGLALLAAAKAFRELPDADRDGALGRALTKLSDALGAHEGLEVSLGRPPQEIFEALVAARDRRHQVVIDYAGAARTELVARTIEPWALWNADGAWYVRAHCHRAGAERIFRIDRIASVRSTDEPFTAPVESDVVPIAFDDASLPVVTLAVVPRASWLFDHVPVRARTTDAQGRVVLQLAVASTSWLERLLVQLGRDVEVLDAPEGLGGSALQRNAARRVLARYRPDSVPSL